ncbi:T-cell surface protein tactile [Eublepharis macularius]|uniref:T-cell surface protein tactile n=1 Tax=Eublepharis macularius TaxID=481883 RepID=A0AA97J3Q0_EUBMA|nr:T-cell surface protein tactile [Eublepharis macularius]
MKVTWSFQAHYFLILLPHFIKAQPEITIKNKKTVYATSGSNVTLQCCILKRDGIYVTQTQWSKVDNTPPSRIAVYNPVYGVEYLHFATMGYSHSVDFSQQCHHYQPDLNRTSSHSDFTANYTECNQWSLQLNNVTLELTGQYECSFATYPAGIRSSEINLIIKKHDEKSSVVEILLNQTLEIPCFKGMNSSILANATLKWLVQKEIGNEEIILTKQPFHHPGYRTNHTIYKERIHVGPENTLRISPVSILDDGKKFICSLTYHPGMKSITEVKVFVKPEISIVPHKSVTGKAALTCVVRKAFPKPNLLWYMDRKILKNKPEGMFFANEDIKDEEGFYEMRSLLIISDPSQPPIPQIFRCMAVYPVPGNELRNVSSGEIYLPPGFQTTSLASPETITQVTPVSDSPRGRHLPTTTNLQEITITNISSYTTVPPRLLDSSTVASKASVHITHHRILTLPGYNLPTKRVTDLTSQTIPSSSPSVKGGFNLTDHLSTKKVTELTSLTSPGSSPTTKVAFDITDSLSARGVTEQASLSRTGNFSTVKDGLNITGATTRPGPQRFSWPAFVAALLLICSFLIVLGIRKWCHYQKEIMNRPPSFKPPPPPIKYTSMQETDGAYLSCHELENL